MSQIIQSLTSISLAAATRALVYGFLGYVAFSSWGVLRVLIRPYFSPFRAIKGPPGGTLLRGHFPEMRKLEEIEQTGVWHHKLTKEYGHVWVYKANFNQDRLVTTDLKALHYILNNSMVYRKPEEVRYVLGELLGKGVLIAEGNDHKRQRRIMNPAFGMLHIREMTEVFVSKSNELRDSLDTVITRNPVKQEWAPVEMVSYLSCTTLDIIGLAGFDYSFDALQHLLNDSQDENELSSAFSKLFAATTQFNVLTLLKRQFAILRLITFDKRSKIVRHSKRAVQRIGRQLVEDKKRALQTSQEKVRAKDLLTLLIKANMTERGDGVDRQMLDEEVMNQIPTFLIAGHETTSTATSWALYSLGIHKNIQDKLRQEILGVPTGTPTMEELNAIPYLDRVVREVLRYHSVVSGTVRVASQDDIVPLDRPFYDKHGKLHDHLRVKKGDALVIPIRLLNTLDTIWGPDALEFNPDRWIDPPKATNGIPGVWGNQLSFIGGARGCIGFRFAIVEMKALLFALIRSFEFELAVSRDEIVQKSTIVTRPAVRSEPEKGFQLPMRIRRARDSTKDV